MNLFFFKYFISSLEVAANQSRGKASDSGRLRLNTSKSRLPEAMLSKVTIRNVKRLVGITWFHRSPRINDHIVRWLEPCVQGFSWKSTVRTLQKEDTKKTLGPIFNRLKNRNYLRTTGSNPFGGKRSVRNTRWTGKGTQANKFNFQFRRLSSINFSSNNLRMKALIIQLRQEVEKSETKSGSFKHLIQIIASIFTLKFAHQVVWDKFDTYAKIGKKRTQSSIALKILKKVSRDLLNGKYEVEAIKGVTMFNLEKKKQPFSGIGRFSEKIVQKSIEIVLIVAFEKVFVECNHSCRPGHNYYTALNRLSSQFGTVSNHSWVIDQDTKRLIENIPNTTILKVLRKRIHCPVTTSLLTQNLKANYIISNDLKKQKSNARLGIYTLQSTSLNPLFYGIVLNELDEFVELKLRKNFFKSKKRTGNFEYRSLRYRIKSKINSNKRWGLINKCFKVQQKTFQNQHFKKLFYVRYLKNWLLLLGGSYEEANTTYNLMFGKLQTLGLTTSLGSKARISLLIKGSHRFLGVRIFVPERTNGFANFSRIMKTNHNLIWKSSLLRLNFRAPVTDLLINLRDKNFVKRNNTSKFFSIGKRNCISFTHLQILNYYNSKIRIILFYYSFVYKKNQLWFIIKFLRDSCNLTLARKFKLKTLAKVFKTFGRDLTFVKSKIKKRMLFRPNKLQTMFLKIVV